jgi:hypothetical protein
MNSSFDNETVSMGKTHETHDDNEEINALRDQLSARDREISFLQEKLSEVDVDNSSTLSVSASSVYVNPDVETELASLKIKYSAAQASIETLAFQVISSLGCSVISVAFYYLCGFFFSCLIGCSLRFICRG